MRILQKAPPTQDWTKEVICEKCNSQLQVEYRDLQASKLGRYYVKFQAWIKCIHCSKYFKFDIPEIVGEELIAVQIKVDEEKEKERSEIAEKYAICTIIGLTFLSIFVLFIAKVWHWN